MGRFLRITVKRMAPCLFLDGHVEEPYKMSMASEPDCGSNFLFSPPGHICAVTYMTEISLIVAFNPDVGNHPVITSAHVHLSQVDRVA